MVIAAYFSHKLIFKVETYYACDQKHCENHHFPNIKPGVNKKPTVNLMVKNSVDVLPLLQSLDSCPLSSRSVLHYSIIATAQHKAIR